METMATRQCPNILGVRSARWGSPKEESIYKGLIILMVLANAYTVSFWEFCRSCFRGLGRVYESWFMDSP